MNHATSIAFVVYLVVAFGIFTAWMLVNCTSDQESDARAPEIGLYCILWGVLIPITAAVLGVIFVYEKLFRRDAA